MTALERHSGNNGRDSLRDVVKVKATNRAECLRAWILKPNFLGSNPSFTTCYPCVLGLLP